MGWFERTPPEVRRLTYTPTLFEELQATLRDPIQLGILLGAAVGAIGMALARAGNQYAQRRARPRDGVLLPPPDPELIARAQRAADPVVRQARAQRQKV
jgi:hypothetical protein